MHRPEKSDILNPESISNFLGKGENGTKRPMRCCGRKDFLGTSATAALHAAVQVGRRPENQGKNIVVIVPDNGMKYLSTPMYRQK